MNSLEKSRINKQLQAAMDEVDKAQDAKIRELEEVVKSQGEDLNRLRQRITDLEIEQVSGSAAVSDGAKAYVEEVQVGKAKKK